MYLPNSWLDLKLLQLSSGSVNSYYSLWCPVCLEVRTLKIILRHVIGVQPACTGIALTLLLTGTVFALARQFFLFFFQPIAGFHMTVAAQLAHKRVYWK